MVQRGDRLKTFDEKLTIGREPGSGAFRLLEFDFVLELSRFACHVSRDCVGSRTER